MTTKKKRLLGCAGFLLVLLLGAALFYGPAIRDLWKEGIIQAFFEKDAKRKYDSNTRDNLKALHTALMLYHESEGQFPYAEGWMDAIKSRIQTNDLTAKEAAKKFEGGYGLNDAASGHYKGDLTPVTILLFESSDKKWNSHGIPPKSGLGIDIKGEIVQLK